jgi:hypothetical protein
MTLIFQQQEPAVTHTSKPDLLMFLSSSRLTDGMVCDRLGENIALEYVRDSPLFRQQLFAFEESSNGLNEYLDG